MTPTAPCAGVVVIIEDEEDTRELLRELLETEGYRVATAEDGVEGLALLGVTECVCFVILDLVMPRMDGFAVLEAIAADPKLATLPVCISTSAPDRAPGGWACLPKPIDMDRLFSMVREHCVPSGP